MKPILNVHTRIFDAAIEDVRPWIERCWSGGPLDGMPPALRPWRKNPPGVPADALVPGQTVVGHGPFRFRLTEWDGHRWRVEIIGRAEGWHGFDLFADGARTRITHTLALRSFPGGWLGTRVLIPLHDRAVETVFDRVAHALRTGDMPRHGAAAFAAAG